MKHTAIALFFAGMAIIAYGLLRNFISDGDIGGLGTMAMNSYYLLAIAMFAGAAAAQLIWATPQK